ncbi:MAG: hypothetical protein EXR31_11305 [Betaproteobacteria bacterium]|nr:hypothetical protein [Betaproteobacteria bacterium]
MRRIFRLGVAFTLLSALALPARAADPLVMFIMSVARHMIEKQVERSMRQPAPPEPMPDLDKTYPGTAVEPEILKRLIDDSFIYLASDQRKEIFDSLNKELLDPKNAPIRATMIEHFARKALAVRANQVRLSQLSYREKQMLAEEFKRETEGVSDQDIAQLRSVIEKGLLPVPMDLNQLFIAVLDQRPVPAVPAPVPTAQGASKTGPDS